MVVGRSSLVIVRWSLVVGRWSLVAGCWSLVVSLGFGATVHAQNSERPLRVAVVVDTSAGTSSATNFVRSSVAAFVDAMPEGTEMLLASTGRRMQVRVPPTTDRKKVEDSARSLTNDGGPTPLMDALREIDDRFMRKAADREAVYVILTGDGSESSRDPDSFSAWLRTLPGRHVTAYAVVLKLGNGTLEAIIRALTQTANGQYDTVGNGGELEEKMRAVAQRIRTVFSR
jgi:Mg-chelatase subunit ChlD